VKPVRTPRTNITLTSREEGVDDLPAEVHGIRHISTWLPDEEDLAKLAQGARVEVGVFSSPHPPIFARIAAPFCEECNGEMRWEPELQTWACAHPGGGW
jgi:hypothetical protein